MCHGLILVLMLSVICMAAVSMHIFIELCLLYVHVLCHSGIMNIDSVLCSHNWL